MTVAAHDIDNFKAILLEEERRKTEALRLYEPTPIQQRFHDSMAMERIVMAANQFGKSLAVFSELARAVTGQDPHGRYPERDGVAMIVGFDEKHIGNNIYRYLFGKGVFNIIRDEVTGEWRTYRPWHPPDAVRKSEIKPAPSLIPKRMLKGKPVFRKAGARVLERFELVNGWLVMVFSSRSEPAGGFQADIALVDEDLFRSDWYDEILARLSMRSGRLIWGALPLAQNDALTTCVARADLEVKNPNPTTEVFKATVFDNPYMDEETRQRNILRWKAKGDDVYRKRALGELVLNNWLMYPTFDRRSHSVVCREGEGAPNRLQQVIWGILAETNGMPPPTWCRYMFVDPGYTVCSVGFFAVPPPHVGDFAVLYDLLYMKNCIPSMFGDAVEKKTQGHEWEEFVIDVHGAKHGRESGEGESLLEQYANQLRQRGVKSNRTGSTFSAAFADIRGREDAFRESLAARADGTSKFGYVAPLCEPFEIEIRNFKKTKDAKTGHPTDKANRTAPCHAIEVCEYAAAHGTPYVEPRGHVVTVNRVDLILKGERERSMQRRMQGKRPGQQQGRNHQRQGMPA